MGLFQFHTSLLILVVLTLLCALLLYHVFGRLSQRRWDAELWFVIFLLGQAASTFAILVVSWGVTLRYWYVLIPIFALLMAYSCKYALEESSRRPRPIGRVVPTLFVLFIVYFVGANYYNTLGQTVVQHDVRRIEAELTAEITRIHDQGYHVYISENRNEHVLNLVRYFHEFAPRFHDRAYPRIVTVQPARELEPYYTVSIHRRPTAATEAEPPAECSAAVSIISRPYRLDGSLPYHVASILQAGEPHRSRDAGVAWPTSYHWSISRTSCSEAGVASRRSPSPRETPAVLAWRTADSTFASRTVTRC